MKRFVPVVLAVAALLAASPWVVADGGDSSSLLERLSAETTDLASKVDAQTVLLKVENATLVGVLVGEPARLVVAIDDVPEHGRPPREAKATLADGKVVDAHLLDADGELGLALYELAGPPRTGLAPAGPEALRRGALAVSGGPDDPDLVVLGRIGGPLEDLDTSADGGMALLAPGGRLLGLRSPAGAGPTFGMGCAACHASPTTAYTSLAMPRLTIVTQPNGGWGQTAVANEWQAQTLDQLRVQPTTLRWWMRTAGVAAARGSFVPGTVVARALEDVARSGRLPHAYLGVVTEEKARWVAWAPSEEPTGYVTDAQGVRLLKALAPGNHRVRPFETADGGRSWFAAEAPAASVRLASVLHDSPAAKAGLEKGQEILEVDGRPFAGARGFAQALARRRPGEVLQLTVKGWAEPAKVVLGDREKEGRDLASAATVGLEVQTLSADLIAFLGLPKDTQGVVVRSVGEGSAAAAAGLQRGDVLIDGGNGPIRDAGELDAVLGAAKETVLLGGRRAGTQVTFTLALPAPGAPRKAR